MSNQNQFTECVKNTKMPGCSNFQDDLCKDCHYRDGFFAVSGDENGRKLTCQRVHGKWDLEEHFILYGSIAICVVLLILFILYCKFFRRDDGDFYENQASKSILTDEYVE